MDFLKVFFTYTKAETEKFGNTKLNIEKLENLGAKTISLKKIGLSKKQLGKLNLQESDLEKVQLQSLLFFPYHDFNNKKIQLSKIDVFFYSYLFRVIYTVTVLLFILLGNEEPHINLALFISTFGCIKQGLGGACTVLAIYWILYNLARILF